MRPAIAPSASPRCTVTERTGGDDVESAGNADPLAGAAGATDWVGAHALIGAGAEFALYGILRVFRVDRRRQVNAPDADEVLST